MKALFCKTKFSLAMPTLLFALASYSASAFAESSGYRQCMDQYNDTYYCSQFQTSGANGNEGDSEYDSAAEHANKIRDDGVKIFRAAAKKTRDPIFNRLADNLENASLLPGNDTECRGSTLAFTYLGTDANYFCVSPSMHTLLHETVHTIQVEDGRGKEIECEADYYMIKALYYGAGQIEEGHYDDECPNNVDLERSLGRNG